MTTTPPVRVEQLDSNRKQQPMKPFHPIFVFNILMLLMPSVTVLTSLASYRIWWG